MPALAKAATSALPTGISCTSTHCNTMSCVLTRTRQEFRVSVFPCMPPSVGMRVSGANATADQVGGYVNVTDSQVITATLNGQQVPFFVRVRQHESNLSLGMEVCVEECVERRCPLFGGL